MKTYNCLRKTVLLFNAMQVFEDESLALGI